MSWRPLSKKPGLQQCHKLITSMPRRIEAVIKAKGAPAKYWVHIQYSKLTYFPEGQQFKTNVVLLVLWSIIICWDSELVVFCWMWTKIITIKRTKDLNYFSLCAFNLFNTRVSQFELNYWNKLTFPRHSNLLRCTCVYIYIYIYRERERERNRVYFLYKYLYSSIYIANYYHSPSFSELRVIFTNSNSIILLPCKIYISFSKC